MCITHSKNEEIFSQDFWKIIVHALIVYSKHLTVHNVIMFEDLNQNNND